MGSGGAAEPAPGATQRDLALLSRDLNIQTEEDSAALLSALLKYYRSNKRSEKDVRAAKHDTVDVVDVLCTVTLRTATEWLSQSASRADALYGMRTFMQHLGECMQDEKTPSLLDSDNVEETLRVLLQMCMNSEMPAQAVLSTDVLDDLLQAMGQEDSKIQGMAAAVVAAALLRCPSHDRVPELCKQAVATSARLIRKLAHAPERISAEAADRFYFLGVLTRLSLQHCGQDGQDQWHLACNELVPLAGLFIDSSHLQAACVACTLLATAAEDATHLKLEALHSGLLVKALDLLADVQQSSVPPNGNNGHIEASRMSATLIPTLQFLSAVTAGMSANVAAVIDRYPGLILRTLVQAGDAAVTAGTARLIASLATGNNEAQRYLRLEGLLDMLIESMVTCAESATTYENEEGLQDDLDVLAAASSAVCSLLDGSPENHLHMSSGGLSDKVIIALGMLALVPRDRLRKELYSSLDFTCAEMTAVLSVLSRNISNRSILAQPHHLDVLTSVLQTCQGSYAIDVEPSSNAADAVKIVLYIMVALATNDSNVARHLVEQDRFLPLLFALLETGPACPALENTSALLLVLIRECKINKQMLSKVGVPAIVSMLRQHRDPRVSSTAVQALSGVLTLLAMSKSLLDQILTLSGVTLVLELLAYEPHPGENEADLQERVLSIHEASCVMISCLCEGNRGRNISIGAAVMDNLLHKVLSLSDGEIDTLAASNPQTSGSALDGHGTDEAHVAAVAAGGQQQALVAMLGQLMANAGPDNFVFQAAMHAMAKLDPNQAALAGASSMDGDGEHTRATLDEEFGSTIGRPGTVPTAIPVDAKLQLTLAAMNALYSLLHNKDDLAKPVWEAGGVQLVNRVFLLATRLKASFEDSATKLLVVFFSAPYVQDRVRNAGLLTMMVERTSDADETSVLIATKALAVVCRNSPHNQALAIELGLLHRTIELLHRDLDVYQAKWVILVINALVYENSKAQAILYEHNAVPKMVQWLNAGPEQEVATAAARALAKAAKGNANVQQAICDADGVKAFVTMLSGKPFALAVRAATEALADLAKDYRRGQDEIRDAGAIERLLELMRSMQSTSLVVAVARTLFVLAHNNRANMLAIQRAGSLPMLLEMLLAEVGPVINAAAADLLRVLCSNDGCQAELLQLGAVGALMIALQEASYTTAQSAIIWAINALVQGNGAELEQLLKAQHIQTLLRCVEEDNGAAPGTVRLLLVVFLHSGKHDELRSKLLAAPRAMQSLLDMLRKGPSVEPTKWTASLLSTLCWSNEAMKANMVKLDAPAAVVQVMQMTVDLLSKSGRPPAKSRIIVDATVSAIQALLSMTASSSSVDRKLQAMALERDCLRLTAKAGCCCIHAIRDMHSKQSEVQAHVQKLLKPLLLVLEWMLQAVPGSSDVRQLFDLIDELGVAGENSRKVHNLREKYCKS